MLDGVTAHAHDLFGALPQSVWFAALVPEAVVACSAVAVEGNLGGTIGVLVASSPPALGLTALEENFASRPEPSIPTCNQQYAKRLFYSAFWWFNEGRGRDQG